MKKFITVLLTILITLSGLAGISGVILYYFFPKQFKQIKAIILKEKIEVPKPPLVPIKEEIITVQPKKNKTKQLLNSDVYTLICKMENLPKTIAPSEPFTHCESCPDSLASPFTFILDKYLFGQYIDSSRDEVVLFMTGCDTDDLNTGYLLSKRYFGWTIENQFKIKYSSTPQDVIFKHPSSEAKTIIPFIQNKKISEKMNTDELLVLKFTNAGDIVLESLFLVESKSMQGCSSPLLGKIGVITVNDDRQLTTQINFVTNPFCSNPKKRIKTGRFELEFNFKDDGTYSKSEETESVLTEIEKSKE